MEKLKILYLFISLIIFCGCAPAFTKIEDPHLSLEGDSFMIEPPKNGEWFYQKKERHGKVSYLFGKKPEIQTLSTYAIVQENAARVAYTDDDEFLNSVRNFVTLSNNSKRMETLESKFEIKELLGAKTVSFYCSYKDKEANNKGDSDFLVLRAAGNFIIHPDNNNIVIQMDYSERGLPADLDKNFKISADKFFNGLIFKNQ